MDADAVPYILEAILEFDGALTVKLLDSNLNERTEQFLQTGPGAEGLHRLLSIISRNISTVGTPALLNILFYLAEATAPGDLVIQDTSVYAQQRHILQQFVESRPKEVTYLLNGLLSFAHQASDAALTQLKDLIAGLLQCHCRHLLAAGTFRTCNVLSSILCSCTDTGAHSTTLDTEDKQGQSQRTALPYYLLPTVLLAIISDRDNLLAFVRDNSDHIAKVFRATNSPATDAHQQSRRPVPYSLLPPDVLIELAPFLLLSDPGYYAPASKLEETVFWHAFSTIQHANLVTLDVIFVYSSIASLVKTYCSIQRHCAGSTGSLKVHNDELLAQHSNLTLGGSPEFHAAFTGSSLCVFVYWHCFARSIAAVYERFLSHCSSKNPSEYHSQLHTFVRGVFAQISLHCQEAIPLLGDLEEEADKVAILHALSTADFNSDDVRKDSMAAGFVLALQLHIFLYRRLRAGGTEYTSSIANYAADLIVRRPSQVPGFPILTFLSLLPCWDFFYEDSDDTNQQKGHFVAHSHISAVFAACKEKCDKCTALTNTITALQQLLNTCLHRRLEEPSILCLQRELQWISSQLGKLRLVSEDILSTIDTQMLLILQEVASTLKLALTSSLPHDQVERIVDALLGCIEMFHKQLCQDVAVKLSKSREFLAAFPGTFICFLALYNMSCGLTTKLADTIVFIARKMSDKLFTTMLGEGEDSLLQIHVALLRTVSSLLSRCSEKGTSAQSSTSDVNTLCNENTYTLLNHTLFATLVHVLEHRSGSDSIALEDSGNTAGLTSSGAAAARALYSEHSIPVVPQHNLYCIFVPAFMHLIDSQDAQDNSVAEIAEQPIFGLVLTVFVSMCIFPPSLAQDAILEHIHTNLSNMQIGNTEHAIVAVLYAHLDAVYSEGFAYAYRLYLSTALVLIIMGNGKLFAAPLPKTQPDDRSLSPSTAWYQRTTQLWIDILEHLYSPSEALEDAELPFKEAAVSTFTLDHEAISPLALLEQLQIYGSLRDLPERGMLTIFTFFITGRLSSSDRFVESIALIAQSLPALLLIIIRSVHECGVVLVLNMLEHVLVAVDAVTTWESLQDTITEQTSHTIISFYVAVCHLCELSETGIFIGSYPMTWRLVHQCITAIGYAPTKVESLSSLKQFWTSQSDDAEHEPLKFVYQIVTSARINGTDSVGATTPPPGTSLYLLLHTGSSSSWKEFTRCLTKHRFPEATRSLTENIRGLVSFITSEYLPILLMKTSTMKHRSPTLQMLQAVCTMTANIHKLVQVIESTLDMVEGMRAELPAILSKHVQRQITRFTRLTRFASVLVYFIISESSSFAADTHGALVRSPIVIPKLGAMPFFSLLKKRKEEYYPIMIVSLQRLNVSGLSSLSITSLDTSLSAYIAAEDDKLYKVDELGAAQQRSTTLLQATMKLFTQMSVFRDKLIHIDLHSNPGSQQYQAHNEVIDCDSTAEAPKCSTTLAESRANESLMQIINLCSTVRDSTKPLASDTNFVMASDNPFFYLKDNDSTFLFSQETMATKYSQVVVPRTAGEMAPKDAVTRLLAIDAQLCLYLEHSQPIELLNIHAPFTGQSDTEEQNVLQQFLQLHYNVIVLLVIYFKQLSPQRQVSIKFEPMLIKRLTIFTTACTKYLIGAYTNIHPSPIDVASRGLLYVVDFYVFNSVYKLIEISHVQTHYSMLFYFLTSQSVPAGDLLRLINRVNEIKLLFLMPLLAYWIQLYKSLSGSSVGRRRLRYIPSIRSLVLIEAQLADDILSYVRDAGQAKIGSYSLATFIKLFSYSYRIEAQLPTILRMLNYSFPAQLRVLEAEASTKLKLLKSIVNGDDDKVVALLLLKSGRLALDVQNALEDYDAVDSLVSGGKIRVQKYPLAPHLKNTALYYAARCIMADVKVSTFAELCEKMHNLKYYNGKYRAVKKITCPGCCKDPNPHELTQLRNFKQVAPLAPSHLLLASTYWKYRNAINHISFCSSAESLQEELQEILHRGRSIYAICAPPIFVPTVSFAFAKQGHISIINSVTIRNDEYILCASVQKKDAKKDDAQNPPERQSQTQKQIIDTPVINYRNEYTINSLAFWYSLIKLLLSRVSNIITSYPMDASTDTYLDNISDGIYNSSGLSLPHFSTATQRNTAISKTAVFTQHFTQLMGVELIGKDGSNSPPVKNEEIAAFLPYNDQASQYFEWVQLKNNKDAHILVCTSFWQLINMAFADKGTISVAASRYEVPRFIFSTASVKENQPLMLAIDRYAALFRAELSNIKSTLMQIYLGQKNLLWSLADTELANSIIQGLDI